MVSSAIICGQAQSFAYYCFPDEVILKYHMKETDIDMFLTEPIKQYTKNEAIALLVSYGVITADGEIAEEYKDIVIKEKLKAPYDS